MTTVNTLAELKSALKRGVTDIVCRKAAAAAIRAAAKNHLVAKGLTALSISAPQLALLVGGSIAMVALLKRTEVKFNSDGTVTIE